MASLTPNLLVLKDPHTQIIVAGLALTVVIGIIFAINFTNSKKIIESENPGFLASLLQFCYACFLKPHEDDGSGGQQAALESFYKAQAGVYDATRTRLLRGREDMLGLVAAQLQRRAAEKSSKRRVWVDVSNVLTCHGKLLIRQIGGGTGYNIEAMSAYVSVPDFFTSVYLVDFSPSLCDVARKRFTRLGWNNVHVVCQDARLFRLEDYEDISDVVTTRRASTGYFSEKQTTGGADLITMSYSLSMIVSILGVILFDANVNSPTSTLSSTRCPTSWQPTASLAWWISTFNRTLT